MISRQRWFWSPPFPPSKIHQGSLPSKAFCPYPLSFLPIASSPPISVWSAVHLQQRLGTRRPSVGSLHNSVWLPTKCPFPGVLSSVPYSGLYPPPDLCGWCYLAWVWVEGRRRWFPRNGMESLDASTCVARDSVPSSTLEFPLRFSRCPSLCLPPL